MVERTSTSAGRIVEGGIKMKFKHAVATIIAVGAVGLAIEAFYEHPTLGRGIQALLAVMGLRGI
jgi:hypothetical protein